MLPDNREEVDNGGKSKYDHIYWSRMQMLILTEASKRISILTKNILLKSFDIVILPPSALDILSKWQSENT